MTTLLDQLRQVSAVDCDTLDVEVARKLGPFVDCTSNQVSPPMENTQHALSSGVLLVLLNSRWDPIADVRLGYLGRLSPSAN
jgi:hypothetical protein